MDVNLHVGAHRCGTTTFQTFLARNRTALADAGVVTWGPRRTRTGLFSGLVKRPAAVTAKDARLGLRSCGLIALDINELSQAGYRDLIISEENMLGTMQSNLADACLYPDVMQRLARFVNGVGENPRRIGLTIRAYDRYWASCLSQQMGRGFPVPDGDAVQRLVDQPRRWRDVLCDIAAVFPRSDILVWPFERFAGQPETQLSVLTGGLRFQPGLLGAREWLNRSMDTRALRELVTNREEQTLMSFHGAGRWTPFDSDQQAKLRDDYAADLDWLRAGADGVATLVEAAPSESLQTSKTIIKISGFTAHDRQRGSENGQENIMG